MQKTVVKSLGIFMLVFFVLSMAGAAATNNPPSKKMDAKDDVFTLNPCKKINCFNVLRNDVGFGKKVTTTGIITTAQGGKVNMKSNGVFCYIKPVDCSKGSDSFTYTAVDKFGNKDSAKVTLKFTCASCKKCTSGKCACTTCNNCADGSCPTGSCPTCA